MFFSGPIRFARSSRFRVDDKTSNTRKTEDVNYVCITEPMNNNKSGPPYQSLTTGDPIRSRIVSIVVYVYGVVGIALYLAAHRVALTIQTNKRHPLSVVRRIHTRHLPYDRETRFHSVRFRFRDFSGCG